MNTIDRDSLVLSQLVYTLRNPKTHREDFRKALEKIGEYLAVHVLDELVVKQVSVPTLTGSTAHHDVAAEDPVLVTILRAGVPLLHGMQRVFPESETGFIGMARNEDTLVARIDYVALPDLTDKTVILMDTMIATGGSMVDAIKIVRHLRPKKIMVVGAIASQHGCSQIRTYDERIRIFAAAVDPLLSDKGYIVPGLGDAGDRAYGSKVSVPGC